MQWWCSSQTGPWTWAWQPYPGVWLFLIGLAVAYARLRRGSIRDDAWRTWAFGGALFLLWLALDWPLGPLGAAYQLSLHMVQFLLVGIGAPALLLLSVPSDIWGRLTNHPRILAIIVVLTQPLIAFFLFSASMTLTHWPGVSDVLMATQAGAFVLDMVWLVTGFVFWWPVVAPVPKRPRFGGLLKVAYLGANIVIVRPPVVMMFYSKYPLYVTYELATPVPWGGTPLDDQQLAGAIMKAGSAWIMAIAMTIVFYRWHRKQLEAASQDHATAHDQRPA
jgi:putative membrane protein